MFPIAAVLLVLWAVGVVGIYSIGDAVHLLLLVGLMLLLTGFLKARDKAADEESRSARRDQKS
jgi:hypothetical protein